MNFKKTTYISKQASNNTVPSLQYDSLLELHFCCGSFKDKLEMKLQTP